MLSMEPFSLLPGRFAASSQFEGEDDDSAGATLRREVRTILNRYNYKGDRVNLLHAVLLVCL